MGAKGDPALPAALDELLDSLDAAVLAVDPGLHVQHANDPAEQLLGRSRERLAGRLLAEAGPLGAGLAGLAEKAIAASVSVRDTLRARSGPIAVRATPWWSGGRLAGAVLLVEGPAALEPRGAPDVAALAAGLAHEVKNPLAALRGAAELLAAEIGAHELLDLIVREAKRVDALVERMLDLSRPLPLERSRFRPADLVHELALQARALAQARGVTPEIEERYDPALPELHADRRALFEALVNLVKNAVEAVPAEGGRVQVEAAAVTDLRRRDPGGRGVPLVRLTVRDNGPGLGPHRDRLFTPFFTTKQSGTGLGLALARRVVEAHGGVLTLTDVVPTAVEPDEEGAPPPLPPPPTTGAEAQVLLPLSGATDGE